MSTAIPLSDVDFSRLIRMLEDADSRVRVAAITPLESLGLRAEAALPALRVAARSADESTRRAAASAIVAIEEEARVLREETIPGALAELDAADIVVRRRGITTLRRLGPRADRAVPHLIGRLEDPVATVRAGRGRGPGHDRPEGRRGRAGPAPLPGRRRRDGACFRRRRPEPGRAG